MDILLAGTGYRATRLQAAGLADAAFCQCIGGREEQQDACGVFTCGDSLLAVVTDGMGGLARGGTAAKIALEAAGREAGALLAAGASFDTMKAALEGINGEVYRSVDSFGAMGASGTTLCAAVLEGRILSLFWCGDSRAYLWRGGRLLKLTSDHIYARYLRDMVAEGVISVADARTHPARGRLTGYVGMRALEDFSIAVQAAEIRRGDGLLLCTDGLYNCLDEGQMGRCLRGSAAASAGALIRGVARKHIRGQDNATALVLKWVN